MSIRRLSPPRLVKSCRREVLWGEDDDDDDEDYDELFEEGRLSFADR